MSAPEPRELVARPDPPPGLRHLRRRLADRRDFRDALLAGIAGAPGSFGGSTSLGADLDVAGDPEIALVAELWSRVADSVAAYTELTAGEHYVGTAADWTDLRRTIDLLGYRPTPRAAAHGWIRVETDSGASPLVPAGTQVQAPGTSARPAQTFEVSSDTQLQAEWANLTVTGIPTPGPPPGRELRLMTDPGFSSGDTVALLAEPYGGSVTMPVTWGSSYFEWLSLLNGVNYIPNGHSSLVAVVRVKKVSQDRGAYLVSTDRQLTGLLAPVTGTTYAAYRVRATLALSQRPHALSYVENGEAKAVKIEYGDQKPPVSPTEILVDDATAASPGMNLLISNSSRAAIKTVRSVGALSWSVAPGTMRQVGKIELTSALPQSLCNEHIQIRLVDRRVVAQHYELPDLAAGETRLRIHPRPVNAPERIAVRTSSGWELATCRPDEADTSADTGGRLVVLDSGFVGTASGAPATANLVPIQHGQTVVEPLTVTSGAAIIPGPVTADIDSSGRITSSLAVRVAGVAFDEVSSLYGREVSEQVYTTRLASDGRLVLQFASAAPRTDVNATWRIGGGLVGELDGSLIDTLLGSVTGVRRIAGVGPTTGAADQEDELRMRVAAPARGRALDRAVSLADLSDLALTVPGTSHAVAWRGAGPPECPCAGTGVHLAFLRHTSAGVRAAEPAELISMAGFLDARRDTTIGLCVCSGVHSRLRARLTVVPDPRREPDVVHQAVVTALLDPLGSLAAGPRRIGFPMDKSDVIAVAQAVTGVVGIVKMTLTYGLGTPSAAEADMGRTPAARNELLSLGAVSVT